MLLESYVHYLALLGIWNLGYWSPWKMVWEAVGKLLLGEGEERERSQFFLLTMLMVSSQIPSCMP